MNRKAIFMDIDGTLMGHSGVSQRVIDTIQAARAQGHLFFVCTGRSLGNMPRELLCTDYLDGYVMGCGMHCVFGDEIVYHERISPELVMKLARFSIEQKHECWYEGENRVLATCSNRQNIAHYNSIAEFSEILRSEPITKMTILGPYCAEYEELFSEWFDIYGMGTYSDVIKRGVTKATGMQRILDYVGISRENCIGVGDSMNDLPMIRYAGLGVAMGNAPESVRAQADVVTETCVNDGVAVMIERYVLSK